MITLDLNTNDSEALLHHCRTFTPASDDVRENFRLADFLEELANAISRHLEKNLHEEI
jgi:hypothetical protein